MNKKVLVTGGTGYIGSHTAVELILNGYDVIIADNLSNSRIEVLDGIEKITGRKPSFENFDLCDLQKLRDCCRKYPGIESIIHFAALKAVGESVEKPLEYYGNNLVSMINILQVMRESGIPNLVFSSSCTVYGQPDKLPVTESSPIKPANSPYGNTKQIAEEIIRDTLAATPGLKAISLRYFNPIGAHTSALIGELPIGTPMNLVPYVTQAVIGIREELHVFGNDYDTPDGTGIRDYIYVVDLARAHVVAIERLAAGQNKDAYEVFNLGTGTGLSVLEIIRTFEVATGQKVKYRIYPRRPGDINRVYADTTLANNELGWKADTPLEEILLSAWNWEKQIRKKETN
ncbi:MAG TPA: UDP-glucose 4-epimerase GalE [Bacteroidales bacterium]|nr:UDP-glucose 4-epimerase GalE [Bacteroidales bacterium]